MPFAERRVRVNAVELNYIDIGSGPAVVLLHGNALTNRSWHEQLPLARSYRLIAPDLRGHGDSDKPDGPYPMAVFVEDLRLLLDELNVDRAVIAGHSMGGRVALAFALEHQPRVAALVLIATSAGRYPRAGAQIERIRAVGVRVELWEWLSLMTTERTPESLVSEVYGEMLRTPEHVRTEVWTMTGAFDISGRLHELEVPTLILVGDLDRTLAADALAMNKALPRSRVFGVPDAGHLLHLERADVVNQMIEDFLLEV
jgi:pimeloyl-ACP methyl ester carboxylesterase